MILFLFSIHDHGFGCVDEIVCWLHILKKKKKEKSKKIAIIMYILFFSFFNYTILSWDIFTWSKFGYNLGSISKSGGALGIYKKIFYYFFI